MPFDLGRALNDSRNDEEAFELGSRISQIFCGCAFTALSCYLMSSNATRLSYIHRASIEKRLSVCCQLSLVVSAISAFLNFFQLTELDNWTLPGKRDQFVVDTSRPIEWILTCPVMQLSLVLMGGPRIPDERRIIMPALSVIVLCFGSVTLFIEKPYTFICWGCGLLVHSGAMFLNRLQIIEHSRGVEGLFTGDSEFRRATLILMLTWIPFPLWFFLSPEGVGLIKNITIVQLGWAFLNIISKFTLIFYIQRIKDNYNIRVKVKRTMQQAREREPQGGTTFFKDSDGPTNVRSSELDALVLETMTFLGMAQNAERLLKLFHQAGITSLQEVEALEKKDCDEKHFPYDLVCAIQNRYKVWALEMVDDAEVGLEAGEKFYNIGPAEVVPMEKPVDKPVEKPTSLLANARSVLPRLSRSFSRDLVKETIDENPGYIKDMPSEVDSEPDKTPRRRKTMTFYNDTMMEKITKAMEQVEERLAEKFENSLEESGRKLIDHVDKSIERIGRYVGDCDSTMRFGLQDVSKSLERSQALLESKVEFVFSSQNSQQCELMEARVKSQFDELSDKTLHSASEFEKNVLSAMNSRFESLEADVKASSEALSQLQELQKSGMARLDGIMSETTEGYAHQIIQESKAAAYTIQAKIAVLEEKQNRVALESEGRFTDKLQQFQKMLYEKTKEAVATSMPPMHAMHGSKPATLRSLPDLGNGNDMPADPEATARTLEALRNLEKSLADLIRGTSNESSKQLELGLGIFGNTLRQQLDSMQESHAGLQKETEAKIESKLDRLSDQSKRQTEKIILQFNQPPESSFKGWQEPVPTRPASGHTHNGKRRNNNPWSDI